MISFYDIDGRVGFKQLWDLIDWDKQKLIVSRIQARIVKAVKKGSTYAARLIAGYLAIPYQCLSRMR